jgi:hypothetical protein
MDGECMDGSGQFVRKHFVYQAVAVDPAFALESVRHNKNTKVGFTFRPVPYMAGMQVRLIHNFQTRWRKGRCQF